MHPKPGTEHITDELGSLLSNCISDWTGLCTHGRLSLKLRGVTVLGSPKVAIGSKTCLWGSLQSRESKVIKKRGGAFHKEKGAGVPEAEGRAK